MKNKRVMTLTLCWLLVTFFMPFVLSSTGNESGSNKEAEQHYEKANELRKAADYDAAISEYEKSISSSPKSEIAQNAQYWIAQSHFSARRFDVALSAFQKLLDESPTGTNVSSVKLMIERIKQAQWKGCWRVYAALD